MSFSLSQSYEKFTKLRQKLRELTANIFEEDQGRRSNRQSLQISRPKITEKDEGFIIHKSKQFLQSKGEQTQRKRKKSHWRQEQIYPSKENVNHNSQLLRKKQEALNDINRLLEIKKEYLEKIENQLTKQNKRGVQVKVATRDRMQQTLKYPSNKLKVPNLYEIQQQKRKQRQRNVKQKYV